RRVNMSATGSVILICGFSLFSLWFPESVHRNRTYNVVGLLVCLEREAQSTQQRAAFFVVFCGRHDGDIHTAHAIDFVLIDFVEHGLFGQTEGVVAVAIELAWAQASEVTNTWQCEGNQTVQELPHTVATHGDVRANWHSFAQFELCNGLLGAGYLRFLTGDLCQVCDRTVDDFRVTCSFTDTHIDHDLYQTWDLHYVRVFKLILQCGLNFVPVLCLQTMRDFRGCVFRYLGHYSSFPEALAKRTFTVLVSPSSSTSSKR